MTKELKALIKYAERCNFTVVYGRHLKFRRGSQTVIVSKTPSCRHGITNARKDLERAIQNGN